MSVTARSQHVALLQKEPENEYERERFLQIQKLQGVLKQMVQPAIDDLRATQPQAQKKSQPIKRQYVRERPVHAPRRSTRLGDQPAVQYNIHEIFNSFEGEERKRTKLGTKARRLVRGDPNRKTRCNDDGWNPYMGIASGAAADEAREEAEAKVSRLEKEGKTACVKFMSDSQVSGGFWCQLPRPFARAFNRSSKRVVNLNYDGRSWDVVLLPREGGETAGLSGGWRSFAIDQVIYPNDSVVFAKVDESNIDAFLYRAYDYDPKFVRCEGTDHSDEPGGTEDDKNEGVADGGCGGEEATADEGLSTDGPGLGPGGEYKEEAHATKEDGKCEEAVGGARRRSVRTQMGAGQEAVGKGRITPSKSARNPKAKSSVAQKPGGASGGAKPLSKAADMIAGGRGAIEKKQGQSSKTQEVPRNRRKRERGMVADKHVGAKKQKKEQANSQPPGQKNDNVFYVRHIKNYVCEDGIDLFRVRWWYYEDDSEDTWETAESLDAHPGSYVWKCEMPEKFKA